MNINIFRALIEAGAIKRVNVIAEGDFFRIEAITHTGINPVHTLNGKLKTWTSLDATARWLHALGIGNCQIDMSRWQPEQRGLRFG
jgi:hypothetical protein